MNLKTILLLALGTVSVWFLVFWRLNARKSRAAAKPDEVPQNIYHSITTLVTCFFDTLGIGNFAPTTSMFKMNGAILSFLNRVLGTIGFKNVIVPPTTFEPGNSVRDEWIPGTLNVGYSLQTIAQAFIYISIVQVDIWTLVPMIVASVAGAWLGAGMVSHWPRRRIQIGMGLALLGAATLMLMTVLKIAPGAGDALALTGGRFWVGLIGNFALGALMTLGIGLYAPCLILVSLLGMDPRAAFPIMMGSCAFLMPIGGMQFIKEGRYSLNTAVIMSVVGIPPVLIAAYVVKQLPLNSLRWLVIVVVVYTAMMMLRSPLAARAAATRPEIEPSA